jgi:hypothetical protein
MDLEDVINEAKKKIRKAQRELRKLPPETQRAIGILGGKVAGDVANKIYESRTAEGKILWEKSRIVHHGDAGYLVREHGRNEKNPFREGIGEGLMISDSKDIDKCFYPKLEAVRAKKRKDH